MTEAQRQERFGTLQALLENAVDEWVENFLSYEERCKLNTLALVRCGWDNINGLIRQGVIDHVEHVRAETVIKEKKA